MQNAKKFVIMIAVAFIVAVVTSCIFLFSVKKVSAEFSDYGNSQASEIQKELDAFKGRSILFVKNSDVFDACEKFPYYEITSVKKEYPNVIKVGVRKRVEKFRLSVGENTYILDGEGVVLNDSGEAETSSGVIALEAGTLDVTGIVGKKISTSDDALFYAVIRVAQTLNLSDCVKKISVAERSIGDISFMRNAVFETYTGVTVTVHDVDNEGAEKIKKAFEKYDGVSDYEKTAYYINAYLRNGEPFAEWTSHYNPE